MYILLEPQTPQISFQFSHDSKEPRPLAPDLIQMLHRCAILYKLHSFFIPQHCLFENDNGRIIFWDLKNAVKPLFFVCVSFSLCLSLYVCVFTFLGYPTRLEWGVYPKHSDTLGSFFFTDLYLLLHLYYVLISLIYVLSCIYGCFVLMYVGEAFVYLVYFEDRRRCWITWN